MQTKQSPYDPITPELAASGLLIPIKESAAAEFACESTLKANAKARRLRAYQQYFGAPVMVLPSDVEVFLKSRTDIASKYHPKGSPAVSTAGHSPTSVKPKARDEFHFPDGDGTCGAVGDFGIHITLRSFGNTTPSERNLVAKAFTEVARQINETITATAGNHPQH
jgi:hypothetical protein